jgi:hypothetical protein
MISNCLPIESATDLGSKKINPKISKTNKMVKAISTAKKGERDGKGMGTSRKISRGTTDPRIKNPTTKLLIQRVLLGPSQCWSSQSKALRCKESSEFMGLIFNEISIFYP